MSADPSFSVHTPARPPAVMRVEKSVAHICAWHDPKPIAKNAADAWAKAQNLEASHGICEKCYDREFLAELGPREATTSIPNCP